ncbi:MAG: hypothetical protein Tsb0020_54140 [Haliangiales bacterium]
MVSVGMSALAEIAAIYRASKKKRDINRWTEWVCRPLAAALVYAVRNTRVTPNQLTFLSLAVCAVSGAMLLAGDSYGWVLTAVVVFEVSFVLDCADGQLARLRRQASVLGHQLDFLMDEIKAFLVYGCVTVHLYRFSDWPEDAELYLLVGVLGLVCLASGIACTSFMRRPEYGAPPPTEDGQPAVIKRRSGATGLAVTGLEHAARAVVHYPSYIWLLAVIGRLDVYFWAYTAVNGLYVARCLAMMGLKLGRSAPVAAAGDGDDDQRPTAAEPPAAPGSSEPSRS